MTFDTTCNELSPDQSHPRETGFRGPKTSDKAEMDSPGLSDAGGVARVGESTTD